MAGDHAAADRWCKALTPVLLTTDSPPLIHQLYCFLGKINKRLDIVGTKISELENIAIETIQVC